MKEGGRRCGATRLTTIADPIKRLAKIKPRNAVIEKGNNRRADNWVVQRSKVKT
jgi:hypothetical protein